MFWRPWPPQGLQGQNSNAIKRCYDITSWASMVVYPSKRHHFMRKLWPNRAAAASYAIDVCLPRLHPQSKFYVIDRFVHAVRQRLKRSSPSKMVSEMQLIDFTVSLFLFVSVWFFSLRVKKWVCGISLTPSRTSSIIG